MAARRDSFAAPSITMPDSSLLTEAVSVRIDNRKMTFVFARFERSEIVSISDAVRLLKKNQTAYVSVLNFSALRSRLLQEKLIQ